MEERPAISLQSEAGRELPGHIDRDGMARAIGVLADEVVRSLRSRGIVSDDRQEE